MDYKNGWFRLVNGVRHHYYDASNKRLCDQAGPLDWSLYVPIEEGMTETCRTCEQKLIEASRREPGEDKLAKAVFEDFQRAVNKSKPSIPLPEMPGPNRPFGMDEWAREMPSALQQPVFNDLMEAELRLAKLREDARQCDGWVLNSDAHYHFSSDGRRLCSGAPMDRPVQYDPNKGAAFCGSCTDMLANLLANERARASGTTEKSSVSTRPEFFTGGAENLHAIIAASSIAFIKGVTDPWRKIAVEFVQQQGLKWDDLDRQQQSDVREACMMLYEVYVALGKVKPRE